jgi:hypothetical protein
MHASFSIAVQNHIFSQKPNRNELKPQKKSSEINMSFFEVVKGARRRQGTGDHLYCFSFVLRLYFSTLCTAVFLQL